MTLLVSWVTQRLRTVCDNTTLRSSGARGLEVSRCYRHIAPLERKAKLNHAPSGVASPFPALNPYNP